MEFILRAEVNNLHHQLHGSLDVVGRQRVVEHRYPDDDIGTHLPRHVRREVVAHPTIHQQHLPLAHRREDPGNGHRGPQRFFQVAPVEINFGIGNDIRGHAGERNGEGVEVQRVQIALQQTREEPIEVHATNKSSSLIFLAVESESVPEGIGVQEAPGFHVQFLGGDAVAQDITPVLVSHQGVQLVGSPSDSIESADEGSHRGAANHVNR